jgi:hypothetical protein
MRPIWTARPIERKATRGAAGRRRSDGAWLAPGLSVETSAAGILPYLIRHKIAAVSRINTDVGKRKSNLSDPRYLRSPLAVDRRVVSEFRPQVCRAKVMLDKQSAD